MDSENTPDYVVTVRWYLEGILMLVIGSLGIIGEMSAIYSKYLHTLCSRKFNIALYHLLDWAWFQKLFSPTNLFSSFLWHYLHYFQHCNFFYTFSEWNIQTSGRFIMLNLWSLNQTFLIDLPSPCSSWSSTCSNCIDWFCLLNFSHRHREICCYS